MTIIELNIAGLHVTGSTSDLTRVQRSWQRSCRALRRTVKSVNWRAVPPRQPAAERPAA